MNPHTLICLHDVLSTKDVRHTIEIAYLSGVSPTSVHQAASLGYLTRLRPGYYSKSTTLEAYVKYQGWQKNDLRGTP